MRKLVCFLLLLIFSSTTVYGAQPEVAAHAAILMDAKTGRILWEKDAHTPKAMASTTKIMTAILALEYISQDSNDSKKSYETVTVSRKAAAAPKMKMNLTAGEKICLYNLMQALMLESSNDAAVAIAEHIGGSVPEFCAQMTKKAHELGAINTVYKTPSGLDAENHHSTAYDLALIARYALEVPGFIQLTNTQNATFSSDKRSYSLVNKNRLLHEFNGANGVKTGFTNKAGHCFVGAAKQGDMQLISVVLASGWGTGGRAQKWVDTKAVLNYGFGNFEYETIINEEESAGFVAITRSRSPQVNYGYVSGMILPLTEEEEAEVKIIVPESIPAPVSKGDIIGKAEVYLNGNLYAEIDLKATEDATRHDFKTSMEKVLSQWLSQLLERPVEVLIPEKSGKINVKKACEKVNVKSQINT